MAEASRNRRFIDLFFSALFLIGIIWLSSVAWDLFGKEERARTAARETAAQLATLVARQETLANDIADLSTPRGEESVYRETMGVARPGEEVIIVVPTEATTSVATSSWWSRLLGWFGF